MLYKLKYQRVEYFSVDTNYSSFLLWVFGFPPLFDSCAVSLAATAGLSVYFFCCLFECDLLSSVWGWTFIFFLPLVTSRDERTSCLGGICATCFRQECLYSLMRSNGITCQTLPETMCPTCLYTICNARQIKRRDWRLFLRLMRRQWTLHKQGARLHCRFPLTGLHCRAQAVCTPCTLPSTLLARGYIEEGCVSRLWRCHWLFDSHQCGSSVVVLDLVALNCQWRLPPWPWRQ